MSRNYKFHNHDGVYFVSFAVVEWLDAYTRNEFKKILDNSMDFYEKEKGRKYRTMQSCGSGGF